MTPALELRFISRRASIVSAILIAAALTSAAAVFYVHESRAVRDDRVADIGGVARLKADAIERWRAERLAHVSEIASSPFFSRVARAVAVGEAGAPRADLIDRLERTRLLFADRSAAVVSPAGDLIVSAGSASPLTDVERQEVAMTIALGGPMMGDFLRAEEGRAIVLDALAPLFDAKHEPFAVLLIRTDPYAYLYPLIESWPLKTATAEALLVERRADDVLFLNPLRFAPEAALSLRMPLTRAELLATKGALGLEWAGEGYDYRGVAVVGATRAVKGTKWFVVAKQDRSEAFAGMRTLEVALGAGTLLLILLASASAGFVYKAQGKEAYRRLFRAEHERSEALESFKATLESIGDAVIATDSDGRVRIVNPVAERLTGWTQGEALGRPLSEVFRIVDEGTGKDVEDPVARVLREGEIVGLANHTLLIARDGTRRPIADSGAPIRDSMGIVSGVVLVFRDQTAERESIRQTMLLTTAIRASVDEIYLFEPDTLRFRFANDSALANLGYTADEIRTLTPLDLKPEFTRESFAALAGRLRSGELRNAAFATVHRRADGSTYPVEVHLQLVNHLGDEVFLSVIQDITERVRGEEALQRLNRALRTVSECNEFLVRADDELELLRNICRNIVEIGGHRMAWVGYVEHDEEKSVRPIAWAGSVDGYLDEIRVSWADDTFGGGPTGTAIRERRAAVVADMKTDSRYAPWCAAATARGFASGLAVPLVVDDDVLGVVCVYSSRVAAFDESEVALYEELASDTAFGLRSLRDRLKRKRAEEALAESEARYRTLFESATVGVFRTTSDGHALLVNPMMAEILGAASTDEAVRRYTDLAAQLYADPRRREEFITALTRDGAVDDFEYEARRADGGSIWIRMSARISQRLDDGRFIIDGFAADVTERKRAEAESDASRRMLEAVSDSIPLLICVTDVERRVLSVNRAFAEGTRWSGSGHEVERAGGVLGCVNAADDPQGCGFGPNCRTCRLRSALADTFATGTPRRDVECQMTIVREGRREEATLLASTTPIDIAGERRVVLCLHDITERKRLEMQLRQAQKIEAVGTLAGGIAHDFNNILQAMLASAQAARMDGSIESVTQAVGELEIEVQRGAALTRQLMLFARRWPAQHRLVDLTKVVTDHARMLERLLPENISLTIEPAPEGCFVEGDVGQLGQVLINLAINARDAMPDGGRLHLDVRREDDEVVLSVEDSGIGIDAETRDHLFEPFFTTKGEGKGTGLGLAVVWGIVKEHGGFIEVDSEPGVGATFRVRLPAATPEEQGEVSNLTPLPHGDGERVLLIEDNDVVRKAIARQLAMLGYSVVDVGSGEEAGTLPAEPDFDICVTDYRLTGATGLEVARGLTERWPKLRVVLMSGYAPDDLMPAPVATVFLQKPFTLETLARALREAQGGTAPAAS